MDFADELVGVGWAAATITHDGSTVRITASYLSDALGDLLLAVWTLTDGDSGARCSWEEEPDEYRWLFHRDGDDVNVRVLEFDDQLDQLPGRHTCRGPCWARRLPPELRRTRLSG